MTAPLNGGSPAQTIKATATKSGYVTPAKRRLALKWVDGRYATRHGAIGQVPLFSASWTVTSDRPEKPVVLRCSLPGFQSKLWRCESYGAAEERAESVLTNWLSLIGASFDA